MEPIAIKLDDYWTKNRRAKLNYSKGFLIGYGISFDVWRHMLTFDDGTWFCGIYGAQDDNFIAISISPTMKITKHEPFSLSTDALVAGNVSKEISSCRFSALTPKVLQVLGFEQIENIEPNESINELLHLHDDFVFTLSIKHLAQLQKAISLIIRVHAHYLNKKMSIAMENQLKDQIQALLLKHIEIVLQSNATTGKIAIQFKRPADNWFYRLFGFKKKCEMIIGDDNCISFG